MKTTVSKDNNQITIHINVYIDLICPWCFIGVKRLQAALALRPLIKARIHWCPYFLNREVPDQTPDFYDYMKRKVGGEQRLERFLKNLEEAGSPLGINFNFPAIQCVSRTLEVHKILWFAQTTGDQTNMIQALFNAYFCEGQNIGSPDFLIPFAKSFGFLEKDVRALLFDKKLSNQIIKKVETTHQYGSAGIPLFEFEKKFRITGAHEPEVLARLIDVTTCFVSQGSPAMSLGPVPQSPLTPT